jgi:hypothetical protein
MLLVLTGTTGLVDAVSYLGFGHVFTANMTGNHRVFGFRRRRREGFVGNKVARVLGGFSAGRVDRRADRNDIR